MSRKFFVWLHRWVGLLMVVFLIIVGLTGSLLAFYADLDKLIAPQFYAKPQPGIEKLDLASIAEKAQKLLPHAQVFGVYFNDDQNIIIFRPKTDPATGKPYDLGFDQLFVNPWTGEELGRRKGGDLSQGIINLMPFVYDLHMMLAMGETGMWILGIVALAWTIDCFYAFYLTFPVVFSRFFSRWKPAWKIKWRASAYRLNFDLHRASGLWLWPLLFIFAWSSVMFNLPSVYEGTMHPLLTYPSTQADTQIKSAHPIENPVLDFRGAQKTADKLISEQAAKHGFTVIKLAALIYDKSSSAYTYSYLSSLDLMKLYPLTTLTFDGNTGALKSMNMPIREPSGVFADTWLKALHRADVFGMPYRILVCLLGLVITMQSVTGVYIWLKKRNARKTSQEKHARLVQEVTK